MLSSPPMVVNSAVSKISAAAVWHLREALNREGISPLYLASLYGPINSITSTNETIQFSIPEDQNFFSVLLPNGKYYAYAWAPGYNLEGAYTDSSGLMKTFVVNGGQTTANINLCDWSPYPHGRGQ